MSNGIEISQEGIGVDQASDYQKVLDSRWLSMEVMHEVDVVIDVPAMTSGATNEQQIITIFKHGLSRDGHSFVPAFHANWRPEGEYDTYTPEFGYGTATLFCDDTNLCFYRPVYASSTVPAFKLVVQAKIYNLPILEAYQAPTEISIGGGRSESRYGVQALDGSNPSLALGGKASYGYSIDTKKKVLAINKVTTKYINDPATTNKSSSVTAIDISTDTFTYTPSPGDDWIVDGMKVIYMPGDYATYPAPMVYGQYYVIKTGLTTFQLSYTLGGAAINLTTTGVLPGNVNRVALPDDYAVPHGGKYPPSFFFCEFDNTTFGKMVTYALRNSSLSPLVLADSTYLYFRGVQSVYIAKVAVIILKDPLEILA
jgi:hypothetical protein